MRVAMPAWDDPAMPAPSLAPDGTPPRSPRWHWFAERATAVWYIASSFVAAALYAIAAPVDAVVYGVPAPASLFLPLVQSLALVGIVRFPVASILAFAGAGAIVPAWGAPGWLPWPWPVTSMILFALLTATAWARHGWRWGLPAFLVPAVAVTVWTPVDYTDRSLSSSIVALALAGVASAVGGLVSDRIRMAGRLTRERAVSQAETERRLVAEERQRIAREMHDVVAHGLSLIQVQATSAPYRVSDAGPESSAEFADIARAARESLGEMRRLLGALRGDDDAGERAPQPTLEDLPRLVGETERAGADIGLSMAPPDPVPAAVGVAAFRIVQEAISNAVRHAPGARIDVAVGGAGGDALLIEVQNEPVPGDAGARGSGHGLVGMRERAALLRGSLQAGPTAAGGFRVAASLPLHAEEDA